MFSRKKWGSALLIAGWLSGTGPAWAQQAANPYGVRYVDPSDRGPRSEIKPPLYQQRWFWWVIGGASLLSTAALVGVGVGVALKNRVTIPNDYPQQPVPLPLSLHVTWRGR